MAAPFVPLPSTVCPLALVVHSALNCSPGSWKRLAWACRYVNLESTLASADDSIVLQPPSVNVLK